MENIYATQEVNPIGVSKQEGFSFFNLIRDICEGSELSSLHRFCTLMRKMGAKWLIREELISNKILKKEINAIKLRCGNNPKCEFERITLFCDIEKEKIHQEIAQKDLLGYAIIGKIIFEKQNNTPIKDRFYIFESVVRFPSKVLPILNSQGIISFERIPITNYYYHCADNFETTVGTEFKHTNYTINGIYFTQQNNLTSVCAHASLQMAINNAPRLGVKKITSEDINMILGIDHTTPKTKVGLFELDTNANYQNARDAGLTTPEIIQVTKALGLRSLFADFLKSGPVECYKWIYPHIESCFPTILGIQKEPLAGQKPFSHVVTALGHTMNSDRWEPEARSGYRELMVWPYYSTCDWVDHFIINDDNLGMGRTLATEQLRDTDFRKKDHRLHASMAISIVPEEILTPGINAELFASAIMHDFIKILKQHGKPLLKWQEELTKNKISCRTFACNKRSYIEHLSSNKDNFGNNVSQENIKLINNALPTTIWVTEISLPDIFCGNKAKLGDVLSRTDFKYTGQITTDLKAIKFMWFPGFATLDLLQPRELDWPLEGYIPLQRQSEINYKQMEW